jgi:hypothetical protein
MLSLRDDASIERDRRKRSEIEAAVRRESSGFHSVRLEKDEWTLPA